MTGVVGLLLQTFIDFIVQNMGCPVEDVSFGANGMSAINQMFASQSNGQTLWDYFIIFGIGLTVCYFIIEMNKRWAFEGGSMTMKSLALPLLKLIIAIIALMKLGSIFSGLLEFNDGYMKFLSQLDFGDPEGNLNGLGKAIAQSTNFWGRLLLIGFGLLGLAVGLVVNLVWVYKGILYKIELVLRVFFAPIACADIYSGQNSTLIKYFKGTIALILYGGTLILIPKITIILAFSNFTQNIPTDPVSQAVANDPALALIQSVADGGHGMWDILLAGIKLIIAPIAALGLTSSAKSMIKEALS